jgi:ferritin-like metal-binding protein YciE
MSVDSPHELFILLLSNARQGVESADRIFDEMRRAVSTLDIRETLEALVFVSRRELEKLDECFKILSEQPVPFDGRLYKTFLEGFRADLNQIRSPIARQLYILAKVSHLTHLRIGEYVALIAIADMTGHCGIGALLESCHAEKSAFVERTRRLIENIIEGKAAGNLAA